jgi:hypothetical protein
MSIENLRPIPEKFKLQGERKLTPEEEKGLVAAANLIQEFRSNYTDQKPPQFSTEQFHLLISNEKGVGSLCPESQNIVVTDDEDRDSLDFAKTSLHELAHYYSQQSFFVDEVTNEKRQHRVGLKVTRDENKEIKDWGWLNEAVTEKIAMQLLPSLIQNFPELLEIEQKKIDVLRTLNRKSDEKNIQNIRAENTADGGKVYRLRKYSYPRERERLDQLLTEYSFKKNKPVEEIWEMILQSYFGKSLRNIVELFSEE